MRSCRLNIKRKGENNFLGGTIIYSRIEQLHVGEYNKDKECDKCRQRCSHAPKRSLHQGYLSVVAVNLIVCLYALFGDL